MREHIISQEKQAMPLDDSTPDDSEEDDGEQEHTQITSDKPDQEQAGQHSDTNKRNKKRKGNETDYICLDGTELNLKDLKSHYDTTKFFIDKESGLLYFINKDDEEVLVVPDYKDGNGESLRYHIFMEMHDSPFYGHRGIFGT